MRTGERSAKERCVLEDLEKVRARESELYWELYSLVGGREAPPESVGEEADAICRRERLRKELIPQAHAARLRMEASVARCKARAFEEGEAGGKASERARWQAERLEEHALELGAFREQV